MRTLLFIKLSALLLLSVGCDREPRCSGAAHTLCLRVETDALQPPPDHLRVEAQIVAPANLAGRRVSQEPDVSALKRAYYLVELDLSAVPAATQLQLTVAALRASQVIASDQRTIAPGDVTVRLLGKAPTDGGVDSGGTDGGGGADGGQDGGADGGFRPDFTTPTLTIGRGDFTKAQDACVAGPQGLLYVTDRDAAQIAIYPSYPGTARLGTITRANSGDAASALSGSLRLHCDDKGLFVSDAGKHRVLYYAGSPGNNASATAVWGQQDFTAGSVNAGGAISDKSLSSPHGVFYFNESKLVIADRGNQRVLIINVGRGQLANLRMYPALPCVGAANCTSAGAGLFNGPEAAFLDNNSRLAVADSGNNRALLLDSPYGTAVAAIGQPGTGTTSAGSGAAGLRSPTALVLSDGFLYLSDAGNARVQIYRQANLPGTSGISAEATIGPARPDQAGSDTVLSPVGVHTFKSGAEGYLLVTDQGSGARKSAVLVYRLY